jgi:hypothetical protein
MIQEIKNHPILSNFVEETCCENEVCVSFDNTISSNDYAIIKVDNYYNSALHQGLTPASVDCLIVRKCINSGYGLTIVELKNIHNSKGFGTENMIEKFQTTLADFIEIKFPDELFLDYNDVKLFFVSNKEIYKRDLGLKMETLINIKFRFQDRNLMIRPLMPTPTIKNCYG